MVVLENIVNFQHKAVNLGHGKLRVLKASTLPLNYQK